MFEYIYLSEVKGLGLLTSIADNKESLGNGGKGYYNAILGKEIDIVIVYYNHYVILLFY